MFHFLRLVGTFHFLCFTVQHLGSPSSYNTDADVKHFCRKVIALPLLPELIIEDTYSELTNYLPARMRETMTGLLNYFQGQNGWTTFLLVSGVSMACLCEQTTTLKVYLRLHPRFILKESHWFSVSQSFQSSGANSSSKHLVVLKVSSKRREPLPPHVYSIQGRLRCQE